MKRPLVLLAALVAFAGAQSANAFDGGTGTSGDPYQISTCLQLQEVGYPQYLANSFVLTQDIDCSASSGYGVDTDNSTGFSPIGSAGTSFTGEFDGAGYVISGLYIDSFNSFVGLFARTSGATITDVGLVGADISLNGIPSAGILVGEALSTNISGSYASGSLNDELPPTYHISRVNSGLAEEVYEEGFIVRYTTREFAFAEIDGTLTLEIYQDGLNPYAGVDAMTLRACGESVALSTAYYSSTGHDVSDDVSAVDLNVVGAHEKPIRASWKLPLGCRDAVLSLTANEYGRGVPFRHPHDSAVSYEMDSLRGSLDMDGRVLERDGSTAHFTPRWIPATGHPEGDVFVYVSNDDEFLYIAVDVTIDNTDDDGEDWISFTIGGREFKVSDADATYGVCAFGITSRVPYKHNTCELKIPRSELPSTDSIGLAMRYYGTAADSYWGGLVGYLGGSSTIDQSYAYTTVSTDTTGTNAKVGGLVGYQTSTSEITDSYARGTVNHDDFAGAEAGLAGEAHGFIENTYAAVYLTGSNPGTDGGLTGFGPAVATSSYWDTDVSATLISATGTGKTTAEMQTQGTFVDWDFDDIWDIDAGINGGYPFFRTAPEPTPTPSSSRKSGGYLSPAWQAKLGITVAPSPTPSPEPTALTEGDIMRATGDEDIFIINGLGFKRLFLNEVIFSFYAHLGWDNVKEVTVAVRDSFGTSGLFRNCETDAQEVYALDVTGDDTGTLHHVAVSGDTAVSQDEDFFRKVFCINTNEFNWYTQGAPYTSLSQVPSY